MYRIILLADDPQVELRIDQLLRERMRGSYLMKVLSRMDGVMPSINGTPPSALIVALPENRAVLAHYMREVMEFAQRVPVIAATDEADEEVEVIALQAGAQDCLVLGELTARALARVIRNAVERIKVEEKLAREQEMLGNLLAKLPDRIYFKDLASRFVRANNALAERFHLRDPSAMIGRSDHDYFTVEHAQPAYEDEQRIIRTGQPIIDKLEKETLPDGSVGWVRTSKLPLRNEDGEITGTFGISHDVTAMKLLEETIDAERLRLQELSEELRAKNIQLEHDLVMAKGIQEALLPERKYVFPAQPSNGSSRIECSSVYRPAEAVGGDFFSMIPISETRVGVLICDIMGHGLRAALGTAIVRGLVEELREHASRPDDFLTSLNRALRAILRKIDEPLLVTACYLVVDSDSGEMLLSSAGHPMPLIVDRISREVSCISQRRRAHGPALALFDDATYEMEKILLFPQEIALLFTDGATEMSDRNGHEIGVERFMAAAGKYAGLEAEQFCEKLLDEIQLEAGGAAFEDDVCLLTVERCLGASQPG